MEDHERFKQWMLGKLEERGLSTNGLVTKSRGAITNPSICRWYNGTFRPSVRKMEVICEILSDQPVLLPNGKTRLETVSTDDGLAAFQARRGTPRRRK